MRLEQRSWKKVVVLPYRPLFGPCPTFLFSSILLTLIVSCFFSFSIFALSFSASACLTVAPTERRTGDLANVTS